MKTAFIGLGGILLVASTLFACGKKAKSIPAREYSAYYFSEVYHIEVVGDSTNYGPAIDSILGQFEHAFNLLDPNSTLSQYNYYQKTDSAFVFQDSTHAFGLVYDLARDLNRRSLQYYDPTTDPLKEAWMIANFKKDGSEPNLDSLFEFVGFDGAKMDLNEVEGDHHVYLKSQLRKADKRLRANFTNLAIAYGLDQVAAYLTEKNVPQFHITHQNRVINGGTGIDSLNIVSLGISGTEEDQRIRLYNRAFASKGLQDKLLMIDVTYGYPVDNEMIYSGVSAKTLVESEIFSEAFMIMGYEAVGRWYEENANSDVQSFLVFKQGDELKPAYTEAFMDMMIAPDSLKQ
jgi:thiamine biosynthesis lipoprotein ApbE